MNSNSLTYEEWKSQVESDLGRPLTSQMGTPGKHFSGEAEMAEFMYPSGLTVDGMVALINDDGAEMYIGGCKAPQDIAWEDPRM